MSGTNKRGTSRRYTSSPITAAPSHSAGTTAAAQRHLPSVAKPEVPLKSIQAIEARLGTLLAQGGTVRAGKPSVAVAPKGAFMAHAGGPSGHRESTIGNIMRLGILGPSAGPKPAIQRRPVFLPPTAWPSRESSARSEGPSPSSAPDGEGSH